MVVIRLLLMMVALERYNKRAQWHQVNPSTPSSRVRLTSGTHQHNFIHTYTCYTRLCSSSPFQVNTSALLYTSYTKLCSSPTSQGSDLQVEHISTTYTFYTSYTRLWSSPLFQGSDFEVEHFSTTYTSYTNLISYSRVRLTCATFQQSFILRILL